MLYVDSSAFVSVLARESRSGVLLNLLRQLPDDPVISSWVLMEAASALALKVRSGAMTLAQAGKVQAMIDLVVIADYRREPVIDEDFEVAALIIPRAQAPLRAGDALHLAMCKRLDADLLTLDKNMQQAALGFGIKAQGV